MAGEETSGSRLLTDDVDDILTVEIAGVAQEVFSPLSWSAGL
jgi:hypothetical protein